MNSTLYPVDLDQIINRLDKIALIRSQDHNNKYICDFSPYITAYYQFDKIATIKILSKCICCIRHQIDKPVIYDKWIELDGDDTDADKYYGTAEEPDKICNCKCRHYSRWICRTCD